MNRLLTLFLVFALSLSIGSAAVAHSMEPIGCVDAAQSAPADGHAQGDADEVPADADKAYPHHHGTCPGHPIGLPASDLAARWMSPLPGIVPAPLITALVPFEPEALQRPPLA
jgi:hypothetical protein